MKALFFDAGPIITLVMSRLDWILPKLKEQFGGKFYITPAVKLELVERPINIKRFEFEALQVLKLIREGVLEVYSDVPQKKVTKLIKLANKTFSIGNKSMDVLQSGEVESVASVLEAQAAAVVMDERTLRLFIESSKDLEKLLEIRFKRNVITDKLRLEEFSKRLKSVTIIRSIELVGIAYKLGLLDNYIPKTKKGRETLLDAVLWATKYNGCAVTETEVEDLKSYLLLNKSVV